MEGSVTFFGANPFIDRPLNDHAACPTMPNFSAMGPPHCDEVQLVKEALEDISNTTDCTTIVFISL